MGECLAMKRRGECRELDQLTLLEACVGGNDCLTLPGVVAALLEQGAGGFQCRGDRLDRRRGLWRACDGADQELLQHACAREQHLALIGEVPEERPLGEPRPLGDLRHRGLLEPALDVELKRRLLQTATRVRLPPAHASDHR